MPMDPDSAELIARLRELQPPRFETLTPAQARAAIAARQAAQFESPPVCETHDLVVGAKSNIPARLYRPSGAQGILPGLIFFHGGGWVVGDLETHDVLCRRIAIAARCAVLAVDYRLAPEHRFPAAVDDALDATTWTFANAPDLEIDMSRIAIGGDSAGANLAAVLTHAARDGQLPRCCFQLLIYPVVDLVSTFRWHELKENDLPVLGETMIWFRDHYLEFPEHRLDWRASPLLAKAFSGLPPAYVMTAGYDPLASEGAAYAKKLAEAGVSVTHRHFPGQIHGFLTAGMGFPTTRMAIDEIGVSLVSNFRARR